MATRDPNDRGSKDPGRNKSSSTGTGGSSLGGALSKAYGKPGEDNIARSEAKQAGVGALAGKKTEGGGSNTQASPPTNLPTGVTPMSQPAPMGATQYYGSPSLGQILGTVAPALVPGGGVLNNAPSIARGKFSTQNTGGLVGEAIDSLTGSEAGRANWLVGRPQHDSRSRSGAARHQEPREFRSDHHRFSEQHGE